MRKLPPLGIKSKTRVELNNDIASNTDISVHEAKEKVAEGQIYFDYFEDASTIKINEFALHIFGLMKASSKGKITDIRDGRKVEIYGHLDNINLSKITSRLRDKLGVEISGDVEKSDFNITGLPKEKLDLKSQFIFDKFNITKDKDKLVIDKLNLGFDGLINSNKNNYIKITADANNIAGGSINLISNIDIQEHDYSVDGNLSARKIDLGKIFFINKNANGNIINLNTNFSVDTKSINFLSDIIARDVSIKISETEDLNISHLNSTDNIQNKISFDDSSDKKIIDLELRNLSYTNLDYTGFNINKGKFDAKANDLLNSRNYKLSLHGDTLENSSLNVNLDSVEIRANADSNKTQKITGDIISPSGSYENYKLSDVKSDYSFTDSNLSFSDITFILKDIGKAEIKEVSLPVVEDIPFPSTLILKNGEFASHQDSYDFSGINLRLDNKTNDVWTGNIKIQNADLYSVNFKNLASLISYNQRGYRLNTISGSLFGGKLSGFLSNQNDDLKFNINLLNPKNCWK